ncbi:hypothetical protein [Hydrogenivirga sp.]
MGEQKGKITTISLDRGVARKLKDMYEEYGGRSIFGTINTFLDVLLTIVSFYDKDQVLEVKHKLETLKLGSKKSQMAQEYLEIIKKRTRRMMDEVMYEDVSGDGLEESESNLSDLPVVQVEAEDMPVNNNGAPSAYEGEVVIEEDLLEEDNDML